MSRFHRPLPFSPEMTFECAKVMTLNGVNYLPGQIIEKEGLHPRLLRRLYESRHIAPVEPANGPAHAHAAPVDADVQAAKKPRKTKVVDAAPVDAPAFTVVKPDMGGWRIVNAEGAPVGDSFETEEEATAALAALTAV